MNLQKFSFNCVTITSNAGECGRKVSSQGSPEFVIQHIVFLFIEVLDHTKYIMHLQDNFS